MPTKPISLDLLRVDGGTQVRASVDETTIAEYADAWKNGDEFPPAVIFFDGANYWTGDGHHRIAGAKEAERSSIQCDVRQGSQRDALKYALRSNSQHGLRRTNADKRRAVEIAIADEEWGGMSSRAVAKLCGVHHDLVASVRNQLADSASCYNDPTGENEVRAGLDGKKRRVPARKPAPAPVDEELDDEAEEFDDGDEPANAPPTLATHMASWNREVESFARSITATTKAALEDLQSHHGGALIDKNRVEIVMSQAKAVANSFRAIKAYAICSYCDGCGCVKCSNVGWLNSNDARSAPQGV